MDNLTKFLITNKIIWKDLVLFSFYEMQKFNKKKYMMVPQKIKKSGYFKQKFDFYKNV